MRSPAISMDMYFNLIAPATHALDDKSQLSSRIVSNKLTGDPSRIFQTKLSSA